MHPQSFRQVIAARTDFRLNQKGRETLFNLPDKLRGGAAVVLRDETPNID